MYEKISEVEKKFNITEFPLNIIIALKRSRDRKEVLRSAFLAALFSASSIRLLFTKCLPLVNGFSETSCAAYRLRGIQGQAWVLYQSRA